MSGRISEITGLRCLAVMMVVLGHAQNSLEGGYSGWLSPLKFFSNGSQGVLIFFVLSGFLITSILQAEFKKYGRIDLLDFYARRSIRIWPAFYFYILVIFVLSTFGFLAVGPQQFAAAALHIWNYSEAIGLVSNSSIYPDGAWYLGHLWSLSLEEQFYWVWPPILIFTLYSKNKYTLLALIVLVPIIRILTYFATPSLRGQLGMMLHTGVDPILIGCYAALVQESAKAFLIRSRFSGALVSIVFIVLFFVCPMLTEHFKGGWSATFGKTIEAALAAIIIIAISCMKEFWLSRLLRAKVPVFLGTISFSLYLWQQLFTGNSFVWALEFPFNIVQAIAAAALSYWVIEKPFFALKKKFKHQKDKSEHTSKPIDTAEASK